MEQPDFKNLDKLKDWIINIHEKYFVEMKKAQELPAAFWNHIQHFVIHQEGGFYLVSLRTILRI